MEGLRFLLLEDSLIDAELIKATLAQGGIECELVQVQTRPDFLATSVTHTFDLILADYSLPNFDGLSALEIARSNCPEVPFIFVSGALGEELAIETLKNGATDYVLKQRLGRLVPSVQRALREAQERRDRLLAQQELQQTHQMLKTLIEAAPLPIIVVEPDTTVQLWNPAAERLFGWNEAEVIGQLIPIVPPEKQEECYQVRESVVNGETFLGIDTYRYKRDGSIINVSISSAPFYDENDEIEAIILIFQDITERQQSQLQLQEQAQELSQLNTYLTQFTSDLAQRNQELDRFVYVVSHDLKAPLRAIANLSQWIEEDLTGQLPEESQYQMDLLRQRVHRMEALIDGLKDYSRIGRTKIPTETVDINEFLDDILDSIAIPSTFTIKLNLQISNLVTKRLLLNQVFANLISNAIKHHHQSNGQVEILATEQGDYYEFTVIDDGPGIAPENHEKIFGIFQTLASQDKEENTGIGLSIVKKIIETEGGNIVLESELGKGSSFHFIWPK